MSKHYLKKALTVWAFALLTTFNSCSNAPDGPLPDDFSWAYGSWTIKDSFWGHSVISTSKSDENDSSYDSFGIPTELSLRLERYNNEYHVCIVADSLQIISEEVLKDTDCPLKYPFVELTPKYSYEITPVVQEKDSPTVISLSFASREGKGVLYLNRSNKTISKQKCASKRNNQTRKSSNRINSAILNEYEADMEKAYSLVGEWQNIKNKRDFLSISASQVRKGFMPMNGEKWFDYFGSWYDHYSYEKGKDNLILDDKVYRRYDENLRRLDEERSILERRLTSKVYSRWENAVYSNTTILHSYQFFKNGTGITEFAEVLPYGRRVISRRGIEWEITDDNSAVKVYDKDGPGYKLFGYDLYQIKNNGLALANGERGENIYK